MRKIRTFIECFLAVNTGIILIAAMAYASSPDTLTPAVLWQIPFCAALCALATSLFLPEEAPGKVRFWVGIILHFISLCVIMIVCGGWFGWVEPNFKDVLTMIIYVVLVYAFTTGVTCFLEIRQAADIDRKLQEKYHSEQP